MSALSKRILLIQGHPDSDGEHYGHALAARYCEAAEQAGHEVRTLTVAELDFPLLRTKAEFDSRDPPEAIREAQEHINWAEHLVLVYPLWLGTMPALLKGFLEQTFRPGYALDLDKPWHGLLKGRSVRIIVTMGMPALFYRWFYRAHSLKSLERNILAFAGLGPIRATLIGMVEGNVKHRERWLEKVGALGHSGR